MIQNSCNENIIKSFVSGFENKRYMIKKNSRNGSLTL